MSNKLVNDLVGNSSSKDSNEFRRYARMQSLEGIGEEGIRKIRSAKVLVVGCGALGSLAAMYLAAAGVGEIIISDFDTIDISNLQRQLFYCESELGYSKVDTLSEKLKALNSDVNVIKIAKLITKHNAPEIFKDYDFVIDGSDNQSTKLTTASVCESLGIPYCIGGVESYRGQVMSWMPGAVTYSDIFGNTNPQCSGVLPCTVIGVLGPVAGVVASVQAAEAIKYASGNTNLLLNKIFTFDLNNLTSQIMKI